MLLLLQRSRALACCVSRVACLIQDGWTPLNLAAYEGHEAVVRALLANPRVDVNAANEVRRPALWV
jgi:hypothetical protein